MQFQCTSQNHIYVKPIHHKHTAALRSGTRTLVFTDHSEGVGSEPRGRGFREWQQFVERPPPAFKSHREANKKCEMFSEDFFFAKLFLSVLH